MKNEKEIKTAPEIIVVGLGPGDPNQITLEAWKLLTAPGASVHVRTRQHPTLEGLPMYVKLTTFDHIYESTKKLEDVYPQIADELFEKATAAAAAAADADADASDENDGRIVYAVPGDPCVAENSVAILRAAAPSRGVNLRIVPGLSFLEPTLAAVGADIMPSLCVVDAIDVARAGHAVGVTVDAPLLLCQLYSNAVASDVKLTLMQQYPEDWEVRLVHAAGTDAEVVETVPLYDIDRSEHIGILSSAYLPPVGPGGGGSVESLLDVIARARNGDVAGESAAIHPRVAATGSSEDDDEEEEDDDDDDDDDEMGADGFEWNGSKNVRVGSGGGGGGGEFFGEDSVWLSMDHVDAPAVEGLRAAAEAAVTAAEDDADAVERVAAMGDLLAHVGLHVSMAAEAGEYTMRDVVVQAIKRVNRDGPAE